MANSSRNERIISRVRGIPKGFVRTTATSTRSHRGSSDGSSRRRTTFPGRVVRADGTLPQGKAQRKLLVAEGVPMRGKRVDLDEARLPREL